MLYKNYKKHGYKDDKDMLEGFRIESQTGIETAKMSYLTNLTSKRNKAGTSGSLTGRLSIE